MIPGLTLTDVLAHNVRHFGNRHAITIDERALGYRELADAVARMRQLIGRHVRAGDRVALWLPNSFGWLSSFLAIVELGAIAVPVNTRLTTTEVGVILEDSGTRLLLAARQYRGRSYGEEALDSFGPGTVQAILVASEVDNPDAEWISHLRQTQVEDRIPDDLSDIFCIQYTSGTTSTPKGVMLTMSNYMLTASYVAQCQMLTPTSSFMSAAPFFHCSGSMHAITVCLLAGSTLHSMSAWDPERLLDLVELYRADVSIGVYFRDIMTLGATKARPKLATLKLGYDTGTPEELQELHDAYGITGISNIYGMTETAGQFTMWYPDDPLQKRIRTNGRPQPGNFIRLGDPETGAALATGSSGEIQMKGPTICAGYFRRPEANRVSFTEDGWFRSGDLGAVSDEGELHFIARLKDIMRVGGENLAPAEIEQALREVCNPLQVCVVAMPDPRLVEVPVAAIVPNGAIDWEVAIATLRQRLAGFKMPRQIFVADALPLTATNKVQRNAVLELIKAGSLKRVA